MVKTVSETASKVSSAWSKRPVLNGIYLIETKKFIIREANFRFKKSTSSMKKRSRKTLTTFLLSNVEVNKSLSADQLKAKDVLSLGKRGGSDPGMSLYEQLNNAYNILRSKPENRGDTPSETKQSRSKSISPTTANSQPLQKTEEETAREDTQSGAYTRSLPKDPYKVAKMPETNDIARPGCSNQEYDSEESSEMSIKDFPLTDSAIIAELREADEKALNTAALIKSMKESIVEYTKKENFSDEDALILQQKQEELMKKLSEFEEITKNVQRLVEKAAGASSSLSAASTAMPSRMTAAAAGRLHAPPSETALPKVIVCSRTDYEKVPKLIVCEPIKKSKEEHRQHQGQQQPKGGVRQGLVRPLRIGSSVDLTKERAKNDGSTEKTIPQTPVSDSKYREPEVQGGASDRQGGTSGRQGGASERQGGASEWQGGASEWQGGSSDRQGGASEWQGGSSDRQGGASEWQGAASDRQTGASEWQGGTSDRQGGASDRQRGASEWQGGASDRQGGASDRQRGASEWQGSASDRQGGASEWQGGASDRQTGALDRQGGASERQGGASDRQGGASEWHGGALDRQGGASEWHGGASDRQGGASEWHGGALDRQGGASEWHGGALDRQGGASERQGYGSDNEGRFPTPGPSASPRGPRMVQGMTCPLAMVPPPSHMQCPAGPSGGGMFQPGAVICTGGPGMGGQLPPPGCGAPLMGAGPPGWPTVCWPGPPLPPPPPPMNGWPPWARPPPPPSNNVPRGEDLSGRLDASYRLQEKLAFENAEMEGTRYQLQEELLNKDHTVDNLQRQVESLQAEMRLVVNENNEYKQKLEEKDKQYPMTSMCKTKLVVGQQSGDQVTSDKGCEETKEVECLVSGMEDEVRAMQKELAMVQQERRSLHLQKKLLKCAGGGPAGVAAAASSSSSAPADPPPPSPSPSASTAASTAAAAATTPISPLLRKSQSTARRSISVVSHSNVGPSSCRSAAPAGCTQLESQMRELREQYFRLQEDYKNKVGEVSVLRVELESAKRDSIISMERAEEGESRIDELLDRLKTLETEKMRMMSSKDQLMEVEQQLILAKQRYREGQDEVEEVRSLLQEQSAQMEDYRNKYLAAQETVEEQRRQIDIMEIEINRTSDQISVEVQRVKSQFQDKLQDLSPLPEILKAAQLKLHETQQLRAIAERNCEELGQEVDDLRDKMERLYENMNEVKNNRNMTEAERASLQLCLSDGERKMEEIKNENAKLKSMVARLEELALQNERRNEEKVHEILQLQSQLETLREESARQVARTKERSEGLRRNMQSQVGELERQLAQSRATARNAQKDRDELRQKMQAQISSLNENFEQAQVRIRSLQSHVNYLKTSYTSIFAPDAGSEMGKSTGSSGLPIEGAVVSGPRPPSAFDIDHDYY